MSLSDCSSARPGSSAIWSITSLTCWTFRWSQRRRGLSTDCAGAAVSAKLCMSTSSTFASGEVPVASVVVDDDLFDIPLEKLRAIGSQALTNRPTGGCQLWRVRHVCARVDGAGGPILSTTETTRRSYRRPPNDPKWISIINRSRIWSVDQSLLHSSITFDLRSLNVVIAVKIMNCTAEVSDRRRWTTRTMTMMRWWFWIRFERDEMDEGWIDYDQLSCIL